MKKWKRSSKSISERISDFAEFAIIIGLSKCINITLDKGQIIDTVLNTFINIAEGLPKIIFVF